MALTINNQTLLFCFFIFCIFAFIAYLFKRSNLFFKMVLFIPFFSLLVWLEAINKIVVTVCAIVGVAVIYFDSILNFLYTIKLWIENTFYGFFSMIRRLLQFIFFPIADFFTWFYNLLSRTFGWNRVFHKLGRPREEIYIRQKADRPRQDKPKPRQNESSRKKESGRDRNQNRDKSDQAKPRQDQPNDNREHRQDKPRQSQSSGSGKSDHRSDKKPNSSNQKTNGGKTASPEEQAKQDAINRAREEVKRAREQAKRKEEQQGDSTGDGGRSYQEILGLSDNFSLADLMKAYKLAVSRYHPDKYSHMSESFQKEAQAEFVKVKKAYNELIKNFN